MKDVVAFFKNNAVQYFSTIGINGKPKVRPFQFMIESEGKLWFCTSSEKDVYKELSQNNYAEVCVSAPDFSWMRVSGKTVFENNQKVKQDILDISPLVRSIYETADNPVFEVFYLADAEAVIADFSGNPPRKISL